MTSSRREFLHQAGCAALGTAALASGVERLGMVNALAQQTQAAATDYKALVCIFLSGGNDGNNTVIPYDEYASYSAARGTSAIAIPRDSLQQISPASVGAKFGLHPSMADLKALFDEQKLAIVCNTGPLVQPLTRDQYRANNARRPYQLFSHSDQVAQWQTSVSTERSQTGWGGRTADTTTGLNGTASFPMMVSIAGLNLFTTSNRARPLAIGDSNTPLNRVLDLQGFDSSAASAARLNALQQLLTMDTDSTLVRSASSTMARTLETRQVLINAVPPALTFRNSTLGRQLKQVANLIALRDTLGLKRQIFFCSLGGFDTHNNQGNMTGNHASLLTQVSQGMKDFYDAMVQLGIASQVTAFTLSDFGRTLQISGTGPATGTDHAWGNHHFILGGAVRGGDFYGTPGPNGTVYPTLAMSGPSDTDNRGRWIPTTSVEQYAATLATWFGVADADLPVVFPNIGRFASRNLGFML